MLETPMKHKTWKREVAVIIQGLFWYVVFTKDVELVNVLVYPVFTYTALAFGMEWYSKSGSVFGGQSSKSADGGRS